MGGCAHCSGCCAPSGTSCGAFGGGFAALNDAGGLMAPGVGYDNYGLLQFHPWFGSHRKKVEDDSTTTVNTQALANPDDPGYRGAVHAISHIAPEQRSQLMGWLKSEMDSATRASGYGPNEG